MFISLSIYPLFCYIFLTASVNSAKIKSIIAKCVLCTVSVLYATMILCLWILNLMH